MKTTNDRVGASTAQSPAEQTNDRMAEISVLLKESIRASNRTTYAVRPMVSYTVISMMTVGLTGLLLWIGFQVQDDTGFWLVLAVIVLITGTLVATYTLYKEWALSKVQNS